MRFAAKLLLRIPDEPLQIDRQGAFGFPALPDLAPERQQVILHHDGIQLGNQLQEALT